MKKNDIMSKLINKQQLIKVILDAEWAGTTYDNSEVPYDTCPFCGGFNPVETGFRKDGHNEDCIITILHNKQIEVKEHTE